jgi:uncharacterized membrane protein
MEVKPGYKTSEFWIHIVLGMLVAGLTAFMAATDSLPAIPKAIILALGPLVLAYLTKAYNDGRVELKVAAAASAASVAAVKTQADAVAVLKAP